MFSDRLFLRFLTWTATAGAVVSAGVHVVALVGAEPPFSGVAFAPWGGLVVLLPVYALALSVASRKLGIRLFDKQAHNRWFGDLFGAVPSRQRLVFWVALTYGLAWFALGIGLARVVDGAPSAMVAAFCVPFYVLIAVTTPRLAAGRRSSPTRRRGHSPPLRADAGH